MRTQSSGRFALSTWAFRIKAADNEMSYLCIRAEGNSLRQATREDGIIVIEQAKR